MLEGHEILEHTADVGIRARGPTLEVAFEHATVGLATILGAWTPDAGESVELEVAADDVGALLVDWLGEVLYVHDARDAVITEVRVDAVSPDHVRGRVGLAPRGDRHLEGTAVKAITYHQLKVERSADGWVIEVYVDV